MGKELKSAANLMLGNQKQESERQYAPMYEDYPENAEFKTERTQILFRKSTKKALKQLAKRKTGGSLNEMVNRICEEYINEHIKEQ